MHQKHYTILDESRIRQLQNNDIYNVCSVLCVSKDLACTLLRRNYWSVDSVFDEWFSDEVKVREAVGLLSPESESLIPPNNLWNVLSLRKQILCKICLEKIKVENMLSGPCGHPFCTNCWKSYISVTIEEDGPGCLGLCCPEPNCKANPGLELVDSLASDDDKDKYHRYHLRAYVEGSRKRKWCLNPGCDLAIQIDYEDKCENYDVICDCSYRFCWNCLVERHHPVDCEIVDKWMKMSTSGEENNNAWIMAFTKPCPKCRKKIEKNNGCDHMTCPSPCGYQFCWGCLKPRSFFHLCDKSDEKKDKELNLESTRESLKRYARHYERWAWNHKSMETALDNLRRTKSSKLPFVIEALEQIVESRRVLKWSFTYGYYLPLTEKRKIANLRCLQEDAEGALERLQRYAEKNIERYASADFSSKYFMAFRAELVELTKVARNCIDKLVRALENDVSKIETFRFSRMVVNTTSYMCVLFGSYCFFRILEVL